ncbi:MAG: CDP-alcohol phosphatidyltransferase family protein [Sinobacteraceae bacterium]|nr:CDP-alcohol phosphatidyltransferase family protein [Nevskiaceae bacterium]
MLRHLPNAICVLRIALTWPTVVAIDRGDHGLALLLFAIAAVSDGIDGYLAKRFNWVSELGRVLDPLADKILLVAVFLTLTWQGLVPVWLATAAIARDVLISAGAIIYRLWFGDINGRPTVISKINTALQIAVLVLVLLVAAGVPAGSATVLILSIITFVTTVASGADYLARFARRAWHLPAR